MLLGVDVGGTFTDAVLLLGDGSIYTAKAPSTSVDQSEGVTHAVAAVLERAGADARGVERFAHGMTVATNALLQGQVARTALIATEGFTDLIELGRQARPRLYDLCRAGPEPLVPVELRFGAPERVTPAGVLQPLESADAEALVERVAQAGPEAVAVVLLHSYAHHGHERLLGELLGKRLPGVHVSLSHELVGTFREFERASTTELDAALSPLLGGYLERLSATTRAAGLPEPLIMQSSGGLMEIGRARAHAALTLLSGPAGGVGGALLLAREADEPDVLCFDMGGTSCDVCLIQRGQVAETNERILAERPLALPMLDIHTVGAGGGSIAWRDAGGALRVGPQSAGAEPGPACYGRGGREPTVTDANLLLGRLPADAPLADGRPLDLEAARRAVSELARELGLDLERCAEGIVEVAESEMLGALRVMTVERGIDPRRFALMAFGGAGPLHVCSLAEHLGIERVLCPRASGVLCALGLAAAAPRWDLARTVMLDARQLDAGGLERERTALLGLARERQPEPARTRIRYEMRYRGQSFELAVEEEGSGSLTPATLREAFAQRHRERYGYSDDADAVELVTIRASLWGPPPELNLRGASPTAPEPARLRGPAVHVLPEATLLVKPSWSGEIDELGTVRLTRTGETS